MSEIEFRVEFSKKYLNYRKKIATKKLRTYVPRSYRYGGIVVLVLFFVIIFQFARRFLEGSDLSQFGAWQIGMVIGSLLFPVFNIFANAIQRHAYMKSIFSAPERDSEFRIKFDPSGISTESKNERAFYRWSLVVAYRTLQQGIVIDFVDGRTILIPNEELNDKNRESLLKIFAENVR